MIILGINFRHGDASACIIKNGKILSAVEEERFTQIKYCSHFPINSIKYCLAANNISIDDIDYISVNSNPYYNIYPKTLFAIKNLFTKFILTNIFSKFDTSKNIVHQFKAYFGKDFTKKIIPVSHHLSHVLSTLYFLEENVNALAFSFDGSGDFSTIEIYLLNGNKFKLLEKNNFPHSLGFYYMAFTQFLGFKKYGEEYKVMGMSGLGDPIYVDKVKKLIKSVYPFRLNLKYFNFPKISYHKHSPKVEKLFNQKFIELFGQPRTDNDDNIEKYYKDIAASMQKVFEEIALSYLKRHQKKFNSKKLFVTGGCAFNSLLIGKIIQSKLFEKVSVGPNPGDAGGAIGSAFYYYLKKNLKIDNNHNIPFSGPSYSNEFIKKNLIDTIVNLNKYEINFYDNNNLSIEIAKKIKNQKIVFWFQDSMEWGPRALGNRSILADPTDPNIKNVINSKIKKRELFRPFAPVVLADTAEKYFNMLNHDSRFMNVVFKAKNLTKMKFPGAVHDDGTSRVQTVNQKDNQKLYNLIEEFNKIAECPMLINTSLNINGPIALNPVDAFNFFAESGVKCLVLNNWVIELIE